MGKEKKLKAAEESKAKEELKKVKEKETKTIKNQQEKLTKSKKNLSEKVKKTKIKTKASQKAVSKISKLYEQDSGAGWDGSQGNFDAKKSKKDMAAASKKERGNEKKFRKALKDEETADKLMKKVKHDTAQLEHTAKESVHKQTHRTKEIEHKKV